MQSKGPGIVLITPRFQYTYMLSCVLPDNFEPTYLSHRDFSDGYMERLTSYWQIALKVKGGIRVLCSSNM